MGKARKLVKGISYAKAPKATFALLNPGKTAAIKAASWTMDRISPARRRRARTRAALPGIGAAAVAVPLGVWLGRRIWSGRSEAPQMTAAD
ncbi:MAG: hypothetical protein WD737_03380 [Gemmatimonadota bacterium]